MSRKSRFALGFVLGLILSAWAFFFTGAGHGTYAPLVASGSFLIFIPVLGILLALLGTPLLWAVYFVWIPAIHSRIARVAALVLVVVLHTVPTLWVARDDSAFTRALEQHSSQVLFYVVVLTSTILCLAWLTLSGEKMKRTEVSHNDRHPQG